MNFFNRLKESAKEFKSVINTAVCGLMAALAIVLGLVASIDIGPYIRIGFSGIPNRIVEYMFGPVVGVIFGGALDVLKFIAKPTGPFFFGFTFDAMLSGFIYGSFYYKKKVSIVRILIAEFLVKLIVNCGFNTLWISILYGKGFLVLLPARLLKNLIMWPIDSIILLLVFTAVARIKSRMFSHK